MRYLDEQGRYTVPESPLDPPLRADEAATLLAFLERQRATFAWKCSGLGEAELKATIGPSPMSLGGMIKHLARFEANMSSEWLLGHSPHAPWNTVDWDDDPAWDWHSAVRDTPEDLYALWANAVDRSRSLFSNALASGNLGQPGAHLPGAPDALPSLRYVLLNMIEEYARHNGHADLIRESIDGAVGQDPPAPSS